MGEIRVCTASWNTRDFAILNGGHAFPVIQSMGITGYFAVVALFASSVSGQPVLEVVSLKSHSSGGTRGAIRMRPDGVGGDNVTLRQWIRFAYDLQDVQILGPAGIDTEAYIIEAKAASRLTPD